MGSGQRVMKVFDSKEAWLRKKRSHKERYGASEVAAVLGQSPYSTPWEVWARKTGRVDAPSLDDVPAVEAGIELEPSILTWYGKRLERSIRLDDRSLTDRYGRPLASIMGFSNRPALIYHPTDDHAWCSPDGLVGTVNYDRVDEASARAEYPEGVILTVYNDSMKAKTLVVRGGVDAKAHGSWMGTSSDVKNRYGEEGTDEVPRSIWWQCQWSCYCSGLPWWDVAAVIAGRSITMKTFRIHHSEEATQLASERVAAFNDCVISDTPPVDSSSERARAEQTVREVYPVSSEEVVVVNAERAHLLQKLSVGERAQARIDLAVKAIRSELMLGMGDASAIVLPGEGPRGTHLELLTWRGGNGEAKETTDWKATAERLAELSSVGPTHAQKVLDEARQMKPGRVKSRTFLPRVRKDKADTLLKRLSDSGLIESNETAGATEGIDALAGLIEIPNSSPKTKGSTNEQ